MTNFPHQFSVQHVSGSMSRRRGNKQAHEFASQSGPQSAYFIGKDSKSISSQRSVNARNLLSPSSNRTAKINNGHVSMVDSIKYSIGAKSNLISA